MQPSNSIHRATFPTVDFPSELRECRRALRELSPLPPMQNPSWLSKSQQSHPSIDLSEREIRVALSELRCRLARDLAPLLEEPRLAGRIWRRLFGRDCNTAKDDASASTKVPVTPESPPEPGDIVELRYYCLPHLVVAESVERHPIDGRPKLLRAIHFGRPSLFANVRVIRDDFRLDNGGAFVLRYPAAACRPAGETVERARSCLGQTGHSMIGNNAGQFARWCKLHSAGSAVQRFASLTVFEAYAELRAGDHIDWPACAAGLSADVDESSFTTAAPNGSVHAEVRAVGRRKNLLALRLLMSSNAVNNVRLEFAHSRTILGYPASHPASRHRLALWQTPALPPERLARRAAALLGAVFQAGAVTPLVFAAELACSRDPLAALAMSDGVATVVSTSSGVDSVQLDDLRVGDVVSINGEPPGLLTSLKRIESPSGSASLTATLLVYGHSPIDASLEPVREFRCFVDCRRSGLHQRIRVSLQHGDISCPLTEACAKYVNGYATRRIAAFDKLQPGSVVSYRKHVSDVGVDDFDENDYDDDDDCHRLAFRHAVVSSISGGGCVGGHQIAEMCLIYFSPAMERIRRVRRVFDLAKDEVFAIEYTSGRMRPLEESLARAECRLNGNVGCVADQLEDSEAWRLGAKYDLRTNNGRQFVRWCRQRDDFDEQADSNDLDTGGVEWLQAWQSRLHVRQLPESSQRLRYCLHRCLQAVDNFSDASPLSVVSPLMAACLFICSAGDSAAAAAAQHQQAVRRAICPGFFAALAASVAASANTATAAASPTSATDEADNNGESSDNNNSSSWCAGGQDAGACFDDDEDPEDVRAFLICFAASVSSAALDFGVEDGGGCGVGFSKQLADLRRFFRP